MSGPAYKNVPGTRPPGFRPAPDNIAALRGIIRMLEAVGQAVPPWILDAIKEADEREADSSSRPQLVEPPGGEPTVDLRAGGAAAGRWVVSRRLTAVEEAAMLTLMVVRDRVDTFEEINRLREWSHNGPWGALPALEWTNTDVGEHLQSLLDDVSQDPALMDRYRSSLEAGLHELELALTSGSPWPARVRRSVDVTNPFTEQLRWDAGVDVVPSLEEEGTRRDR